MPDQTGVPTIEEVENWQKRWKSEWLAEIKHILQVYPKSAVWRISKLNWYIKENGFERWPEADAIASDHLSNLYNYTRKKGVLKVRWVVLDLRGIKLQDFCSAGCSLAFAKLSGAILGKLVLRRWDLNHANVDRVYLTESHLHKVNFFGVSLRHTVVHGCHLHSCKLSSAICRYSSIVFSTICNTDFVDGSLESCSLFGTTFFRCCLSGARLYGAELNSVEFVNCDLRHAHLRSSAHSADLSTTTFFGRLEVQWRCIHRRLISTNNYTLFTNSNVGPQVLKDRIETCSQVRHCFKDNGLLHEAARYYEQEEKWRTRLMWQELGGWRGLAKLKNVGKSAAVIMRYFSEWLIGYGERPGRAVLASSVIIVLCAVLFLLFGFVDHQISGRPSTVSLFSLPFDWWPYYTFVALRFSIECFTTLGFSVIQPAERASHWIASLEGLAGVLLIAMATVTWARKVIRD